MAPNFPVIYSFSKYTASMMYCLLLSKNALKINLMANTWYQRVSSGILNTCWCPLIMWDFMNNTSFSL